MMESHVDEQHSPTGPRRLVRMDAAEQEKGKAPAERRTDPRGYAEPRPTPVQVMSAIRRPPAEDV